jgi:hypothetical protein
VIHFKWLVFGLFIVHSDMMWKRCESVAQLLANCPQQVESVEKYYKKICPQVTIQSQVSMLV